MVRVMERLGRGTCSRYIASYINTYPMDTGVTRQAGARLEKQVIPRVLTREIPRCYSHTASRDTCRDAVIVI
jgi:hypothetical protein